MDSDLATVTGTQEVFLSPDERKSQSFTTYIYLIDIWVPNSVPNSVPNLKDRYPPLQLRTNCEDLCSI